MPSGLEKPLNMSVSTMWATMGGTISPATLARRRATRKANAAQRGREALRRAAAKLKMQRMRQSVARQSVARRQPTVNINTHLKSLINQANKLYLAPRSVPKYSKLRTEIMSILERNNKTQFMKNVLANIELKKNNYFMQETNVFNKEGKFNSWRGRIALKLGGGPRISEIQYKTPSPRRPSPGKTPEFISKNRKAYNNLMRMAASGKF